MIGHTDVVADLRRRCWQLVLDFEPLTSRVCELAVLALPDDRCPRDDLVALRLAGRGPAGRRRQGTLALARARLSVSLAAADLDDCALDLVIAELIALEADEAPSIAASGPPFVAYVAAARGFRCALWLAQGSASAPVHTT